MNYHRELIDHTGTKMGLSINMQRACEASYEMFQNGKDTAFIAKHFYIHEALALKRVNLGRAMFLNRRSPYQAHTMQNKGMAA